MKRDLAKKRAPARKATSTYGKIEEALASTAMFAAQVARGTERQLRQLVTRDPGGPPTATDLLEGQHRAVEKLFERLTSANGNGATLLRELADALAAHMKIEEQLFYPAVHGVDDPLIFEGLEEHAMGRFALERLLSTTTRDKAFPARVKALKELMVNHHREEERELFPKAERKLTKERLRALGGEMKTLFDESVKRGHAAVLRELDGAARRPSGRPRARRATKGARSAHA